MRLSLPILCVIARSRGAEGSAERGAVLDRLAHAAAAGASMVQVRDRLLDDRALLAFVRDVLAVTRGTACRVVVNDRTDVALASGAHGVHLKSHSVRPADVRRIVPEAFLVGASVHSVGEAVEIEPAGGCDYLLFGTVYPSRSKGEQHPIAGVAALRAVCSAVRLPVVAIGGITPARAADVTAAGAAGVAAISWFSDAPDPGDAVTTLRAALTPYKRNV